MSFTGKVFLEVESMHVYKLTLPPRL